ncbi:MAG: hypothetical protein AAB268_03735 [Elusimicrobiota bacterium]
METRSSRPIRRAGLALAAIIAISASPFLTPASAGEPAASAETVKERIPDAAAATAPPTAAATASAEGVKMVGQAVCATCHAEKVKSFAATFHGRKSLSNSKLANACESCHGAGSAHVDGGGDVAKITNPKKLDASAIADLCLKCHTNNAVMM